MIFRSVKPVGVAQMRFVQVPLVEWCLGRVVHSKNYSGNSGKHNSKNESCNRD
jgi:hypothetical protein